MNEKNINTPVQFEEKLQDVMRGFHELFELSKEHNLEPVSDNGTIVYSEDSGKCCFQVATQFERPSEYLESLLDIVRVNFEPCQLGSFFLNSNLCFLYDAIPDTPFQLGYVSLTSEPNKPFEVFWEEDVIPYIEKCGYSVKDASSIFVVASTGKERYNLDFIGDILATLKSGFSTSEALGLIASSLCETVEKPFKQFDSGFCLDTSLENKIRVSLWLFINPHEQSIQ